MVLSFVTYGESWFPFYRTVGETTQQQHEHYKRHASTGPHFFMIKVAFVLYWVHFGSFIVHYCPPLSIHTNSQQGFKVRMCLI